MLKYYSLTRYYRIEILWWVSDKDSPAMQEAWVQSQGWEDPLKKEMAIHSGTLAWKIPWTEKPGAGHSPWGRKELDITEQLQFTND